MTKKNIIIINAISLVAALALLAVSYSSKGDSAAQAKLMPYIWAFAAVSIGIAGLNSWWRSHGGR